MSKQSILADKSLDFAVRIVNLYNYLCEQKKEFVMSKQLMRCGTSIGANISEAHGSQSDADFIAKLHISFKEARETEFWLKLLKRTKYLIDTEYSSMSKDLNEIISMLVASLKTAKQNLNS